MKGTGFKISPNLLHKQPSTSQFIANPFFSCSNKKSWSYLDFFIHPEYSRTGNPVGFENIYTNPDHFPPLQCHHLCR